MGVNGEKCRELNRIVKVSTSGRGVNRGGSKWRKSGSGTARSVFLKRVMATRRGRDGGKEGIITKWREEELSKRGERDEKRLESEGYEVVR